MLGHFWRRQRTAWRLGDTQRLPPPARHLVTRTPIALPSQALR